MRSRIGLKALGLCALVVGMMSISVDAAQASEWKVNGEELGKHPFLFPEVAGELENGTASLLTTINKLSIEILCTKGTLVGVKLVAGGLTTNGKVKFSGCLIYKLPGKEKLGCKVHSGGTAESVIETLESKVKIHIHESKQIILVLPNNVEERFVTIETEGCSLPELVPVFGKLALQDCEGNAETELVKHLVTELKALTEVYAISKTEEHKAALDGSANVFLAGAHSGQKFSAVP